MSRNSVSPFFSQKFQPIFTPTSPVHSSQPVPAHVGPDERVSHDTTGVNTHVHDDATLQVSSESHSANKLFGYSHSNSSPQLQVHTQSSDQKMCGPSQPSSLHSNSDNLLQCSSSSTSTYMYSQSHLHVAANSSSDSQAVHNLPLSVIEEDSYEQKSESTPEQAKFVSTLCPLGFLHMLLIHLYM